uniref:Phlebovirus glycoprotein G2 fusion domain-containing protein n=1 Tax=Caenorhabditis tropicalis TaxID=1561998 RepID=A0A1I7TGI5_9PELO
MNSLKSWKNKMETIYIFNPIGRTTVSQQMAITVESIQTPPLPIINTWFIRSNDWLCGHRSVKGRITKKSSDTITLKLNDKCQTKL